MHRIHGVSALQELIDRSSLTGLNGHSQIGPGSRFVCTTLPALQRMIEFEIGHNLAFGIHNQHSVVVFSPIETSVMRQFFPVLHTVYFELMHRSAVMRRPDTRSLAGICSLRRWDGRRRAG